MKAPLLYIVCLINSFFLYGNGFDGDTAVTISNGRLIPIKELKIGDEVICYNKDFERELGKVKCICSLAVESTMSITTQDNVILITSMEERFFLPQKNQWVCAKDINEGECILNNKLTAIPVIQVKQQHGKREVFIVTIDKYHNFLASNGQYLVHNGVTGALAGFWMGKFLTHLIAHTVILVIASLTGPAAPAVLTALEATLVVPLETASNIIGLSTGIVGSVATGPV
jgi:hypothetical protein